MEKKNLLIGMCGSVAVELYKKIIKEFSLHYNVKFIVTSSAENLQTFSNHSDFSFDYSDFYDDTREYEDYRLLNKVVCHVELAKWADKFVICPATANTIAKINYGMADNMLTSTVLAWNRPLYIVPAMNTEMWLNKITQKNIKELESNGNAFIYPTVKRLACGDFGIGAMADIETIVNIVNGHKWIEPIRQSYPIFVPSFPHLGGFGGIRKHDIHTGTDLYAAIGTDVYAVEKGIVTNIGHFTGKQTGTEFWLDTDYIMVEGQSGVVCYGEIEVAKGLQVGDEINAGEIVGNVVAVLPDSKKRRDIEGHSNSMLHIELYRKGIKYDDTFAWKLGEDRPKYILDPTPYLKLM